MIKVLLVDDQAMVRRGFALIVASDPEMTVVGEAGDGVEALTRYQETVPDVCLVDIRMPRIDGLELTRRWARQTPVVVVTTFEDEEVFDAAIGYGAAGFLLKDAGPALLLEAIRAAHGGNALISPSLTKRFLEKNSRRTRQHMPHRPLTESEKEVLQHVAAGESNDQISQALFISVSSVKARLSSAMTKLDVTNRVSAAISAHDNLT